MEQPDEAMDGSLEELAEDKGFLPQASELIAGSSSDWKSIPKSKLLDIGGKKDLELEAVVELLKRFEEKENLFANFPIGATIQDGGKRKKNCTPVPCQGKILIPQK